MIVPPTFGNLLGVFNLSSLFLSSDRHSDPDRYKVGLRILRLPLWPNRCEQSLRRAQKKALRGETVKQAIYCHALSTTATSFTGNHITIQTSISQFLHHYLVFYSYTFTPIFYSFRITGNWLIFYISVKDFSDSFQNSWKLGISHVKVQITAGISIGTRLGALGLV